MVQFILLSRLRWAGHLARKNGPLQSNCYCSGMWVAEERGDGHDWWNEADPMKFLDTSQTFVLDKLDWRRRVVVPVMMMISLRMFSSGNRTSWVFKNRLGLGKTMYNCYDRPNWHNHSYLFHKISDISQTY